MLSQSEIRVLELPDHPFFVATLYVPQTRSRLGAPHPLVASFVEADMKTDERLVADGATRSLSAENITLI
jgi:CTP synthase (UTP-ammonia lyase)